MVALGEAITAVGLFLLLLGLRLVPGVRSARRGPFMVIWSACCAGALLDAAWTDGRHWRTVAAVAVSLLLALFLAELTGAALRDRRAIWAAWRRGRGSAGTGYDGQGGAADVGMNNLVPGKMAQHLAGTTVGLGPLVAIVCLDAISAAVLVDHLVDLYRRGVTSVAWDGIYVFGVFNLCAVMGANAVAYRWRTPRTPRSRVSGPRRWRSRRAGAVRGASTPSPGE
jgi:hypothetical protein